jgi:hypothetical protein
VNNQRRQFRVLLRIFLARSIDLELLAPGGDMQKLMMQFAALLAAVNFVIAFIIIPRYGTSPLPRSTLLINAWQDEEFLIATTIAAVGLFLVIAWDTLLPDRRDMLVLGTLPVRTRTAALARASGLVIGTGAVVLAVNVFTGIGFALAAARPEGGALGILRCFLSYWITMAAAALFAVSAVVAVLGLASQVFSYRVFLRASSVIQMLAFVVVLTTFFLKPPIATPYLLTAEQNRFWLNWLPSYWFLGLFQQLNGPMHTVFAPLAQRALIALTASVSLAVVFYSLAFGRTASRIVEEAESAPNRRRSSNQSWIEAGVRYLVGAGASAAMLFFIARTISRSRKHRLIMSLYCGIGAAIALAYAEGLLSTSGQPWRMPSVPIIAATFSILLFAVLGMRLTFVFPSTLPANWIFRVTADKHPLVYLRAVRSSLYLLGAAPALALSAVLVFALWTPGAALQHCIILALGSVILVERSLQGFAKLPFTCSYLPGKANLNVTLGMYAAVILSLTHFLAILETWAIGTGTRFAILATLLALIAAWMRYQFGTVARRHSSLQFQDVPLPELLRLDIRPDGELLGTD